MIEQGAASMALVYEGEPIRRRDEKLNLTDMWRASGADPNKRPAEWARKEGAPFIDFIAEGSNVAVGHIIEAERGRDGGTWPHWQVGIAYAKYLSPAFHAWCNETVRDHMEGQAPPAAPAAAQGLTATDLVMAFDAGGSPRLAKQRGKYVTKLATEAPWIGVGPVGEPKEEPKPPAR